MASTRPSTPFERLRRFLVHADTSALAGPGSPALAAFAIEQGLAGLLREQIPEAGLRWPREPLAALREAHRAALARGERQLECARRVLGRLAASGLRALPLKGAALAESLYDSVAERPMADVDILALDDGPGALQVLREAGYRPAQASDHAVALEDTETRAVVELHTSVTSCGGLFPIDRDVLWNSRENGGKVGPRPSPEHQLVLLSLHAAFQHGLVLRLVQFLDVRRLFERARPDARRALELAREAHAGAAVALAIEAAAAVVGCSASPALRDAFGAFLPPSLQAWLARRRTQPQLFVTPAEPDLLRLRWALARGRRRTLLREALLAGAPTLGRGRVRHAAARAASLAWRWSLASPR
jgi:hypothetical protein